MPNPYTYNYLFIGIFFLVAVAFPLIPLAITWWITPKKPNPVKNATYECGVEAKGDPWIQFRAQYYLYALLFVIFDIETIFIYPWAVAYKSLGLFAFVEMLIFIGILAVGLLYAWRKGILEWR